MFKKNILISFVFVSCTPTMVMAQQTFQNIHTDGIKQKSTLQQPQNNIRSADVIVPSETMSNPLSTVVTSANMAQKDTTHDISLGEEMPRTHNLGYLRNSYPYLSVWKPLWNFNLDLSMSVPFGKNKISAAPAFIQSLRATYIAPLNHKMWFAGGGYLSHLTQGGAQDIFAGIYGELGYRISPTVATFIYAQKNVISGRHIGLRTLYPFGMYSPIGELMTGANDKVGLSMVWKPKPQFSIQVSVEKDWYPSTSVLYPDQYRYNYPTPQP